MSIKNTLFALSLLVFAFSCGDDDNLLMADLHHDAENFSAPFLPAGTHEAAARFPASETSSFTGQFLDKVEFYIQEVPASCTVRIYGQGTNSLPGTMLYEQDISISIKGSAWNRHTLSTPIEITGEDLWISIRIFHNTNTASVGCDPGPAVQDGDWTYNEGDMEWQTLRERTDPTVDINWNIRGFVNSQ